MKLENDLGRDPIPQLVLRIAIPSMLAQFVSVLYSIVDRMYIGHIPGVGDLALAGVGVCPTVLLKTIIAWKRHLYSFLSTRFLLYLFSLPNNQPVCLLPLQ